MNGKQVRSNSMLMLTALIWGVAFVAQSVGMDYVEPFTFNATRFMLGGLVLIPCIFIMKRVNGGSENRKVDSAMMRERRKMGIVGGICCGVALCAGASLQQIGVMHTTVGKAGFITALYIVIVPVLGIFLKKRVPASVWLSIAIATVGMYLLCVTEGFSVNKGDWYIFICAIVFSFHILIIDYFSPKADGVLLSCIQFFTAGMLSAFVMFLFEKPTLAGILAAWAPILYAGILSCGVAYTLQVVAQKDTSPVLASLILSLESVFSVIAGWLILGQVLTSKEMGGCMLVFVAIILAQIPMKITK